MHAEHKTAEKRQGIYAGLHIDNQVGNIARVQSHTGEMLKIRPGQKGVQRMTEFMKQCLGLVGAHQAAG